MIPGFRTRTRFLRVLQPGIGLAVIAMAANPRLAVVAGSAAAAVWATRVRYAGLAAVTVLAAVGCFSILTPGR